MSSKELKRLKRADLIEIIYQLQQNESELADKIEELEKQIKDLETNEPQMVNIGSIAEEAMKVQNIFLAAQRAADKYLDEAKAINDSAEQRAQAIVTKAQERADMLTSTTEANCTKLIEDTDKEVRKQWSNFMQGLDIMLGAKTEIKSIIDDKNLIIEDSLAKVSDNKDDPNSDS